MRPTKSGLDYFPLDVNTDDKFDLIEAKHGVIGFAIIVKLFQKIYSEGYFYRWEENEQLLFSKRVNVDINFINEIINDALRWNIFDENRFKKYQILTSNGIQKRYVEATQRRKEIYIIREYWVNGNIKDINANINLLNVSNNSQSKVKKSKLKESKLILSDLLKNSEFSEIWSEFKKHRTKLKKPMTEYAEKLMLNKIEKIPIENAIVLLKKSIEKGWQDVYLSEQPKIANHDSFNKTGKVEL